MGLLKLVSTIAVIAAATGCYDPDLASCTVRCEAADECGGNQLCSSDGFCIGPEVETSCADRPDASPRDDDAVAIDALPPDAAATLRVVIDGRGKIKLQPLDIECKTTALEDIECIFGVPVGLALDAEAMGINGWDFDHWTSPTCPDMHAPTCALVTSAGVTLVRAVFSDDD